MSVRIRDTSRLNWSRLVVTDGVEHWDYPEYPEIPPSPDDIKYTVDRNDRIDLIALRFYNSCDLWWIIALANDMTLFPNDLKASSVIRIPSGRRVFSDILRKPSRGVEGR